MSNYKRQPGSSGKGKPAPKKNKSGFPSSGPEKRSADNRKKTFSGKKEERSSPFRREKPSGKNTSSGRTKRSQEDFTERTGKKPFTSGSRFKKSDSEGKENKHNFQSSVSGRRSGTTDNRKKTFSGKKENRSPSFSREKFPEGKTTPGRMKRGSESFSEKPGKRPNSSGSTFKKSASEGKEFRQDFRSSGSGKRSGTTDNRKKTFSGKKENRSSSFSREKFPEEKTTPGRMKRGSESFSEKPGKRSFDSGGASKKFASRGKEKYSGEERNFHSKRDFKPGQKATAGKRQVSESPALKKQSKAIVTPTYDLQKVRKDKGTAKAPKAAGDTIRLNKYIANSGICSRRDADQLIQSGEITVNGQVVTELGMKIHKSDEVKYKGKKLRSEKQVYVLLNKPKDFLTTTEDPEERRTVMSLVANACNERIYPVGRLDRNTTGLLLFTNDGELAEKLTHPSNKINKVYQAELDKPLQKEDFDAIVNGLELEDGPVQVDEVAVLTKDKKTVGLEIHEGRNRIVRRIFENLGYEVVKLDRVMYAGLTKKDLPRGKWRYLSEKEVIRLKFFV